MYLVDDGRERVSGKPHISSKLMGGRLYRHVNRFDIGSALYREAYKYVAAYGIWLERNAGYPEPIEVHLHVWGYRVNPKTDRLEKL